MRRRTDKNTLPLLAFASLQEVVFMAQFTHALPKGTSFAKEAAAKKKHRPMSLYEIESREAEEQLAEARKKKKRPTPMKG